MITRRLIVTAGLILSACSGSEAEREERAMKAAVPERVQGGRVHLSDTDAKALGMEVTAATEGDLPDTALRFGRVLPTPGQEALVVSPVTGLIPRSPTVLLGATVAKGASLVEVVPSLAAAERISVGVQGAQLAGQIEAAQRELANKEAALGRARELESSKIVSLANLQQAETAVATTRATLEGLKQAQSSQVRGTGSPMMLRAPIAGTVVTLNVAVGAVVQQGDLLVRVLHAGPRFVDVSVPPDAPMGNAYEIEVGGRWLPARLAAPGAITEEDGTRHDRLEVAAAEAVALLSGQSVAVRVAYGAGRGVVVPLSAIVPGVHSDLVFVEVAPNTFVSRPVRIAARLNGKVRIASGIQPGDKVVTCGAMALDGETRRSELVHQE